MKYPTRIYYTEADKTLMWDRWQKGESLNSIARHFGRSHSSVPIKLYSCPAAEAFSATSSNILTLCCTSAENWGRQSGLLLLSQSRTPLHLT